MTRDSERQADRDKKEALSTLTARPMDEADIENYLPYLDETDMSEDQKIEFLKALYVVLQSFVDQAFGVHPVQQVKEGQREPEGPEGVIADAVEDGARGHQPELFRGLPR